MNTYTEWAGEPFPDTDASVFIQWKGTEVCMDFQCACGTHGHLDASFAYSVQCAGCGAFYDLGTQVRVRRVDEPYGDPRVMDQ